METFSIEKPSKQDYPELIEVWEAAVRATHHFLKEEDILYFRKLILEQYFDAVQLYCIREGQRVAGFIGLGEEIVEMLFVHPDFRGQGTGKHLLQFAIENKNSTRVDVNEQNEQAVGFYLRMGFVVTGRSGVDGAGKPYPLLHMELKEQM